MSLQSNASSQVNLGCFLFYFIFLAGTSFWQPMMSVCPDASDISFGYLFNIASASSYFYLVAIFFSCDILEIHEEKSFQETESVFCVFLTH